MPGASMLGAPKDCCTAYIEWLWKALGTRNHKGPQVTPSEEGGIGREVTQGPQCGFGGTSIVVWDPSYGM